MKIGLDYDKTYSLDKTFWDSFIILCAFNDVDIYLITARHPEKDKLTDVQLSPDIRKYFKDIIYCNGVAKRWHVLHNHDLEIDVWIDDRPDNILNNSTASPEFLKTWRASEEWSN